MERIGRYELLGEVGRGGMGVVLRARDPRDGRPVAIKLLLSGRSAGEVARKRFLREAAALARLEHPHVVRVVEAGEEQGTPFLALEWIDGESLHERVVRAGPLPPRQAVRLACDLAAGLAHAHQAGQLHRDVKPGNVLLRRGSEAPVLTDFGLTRQLDPSASQSRLSRTGELMGSPGYWAPEQARGDLAQVGPHSDVYGLGATLFFALTGEPPHGEPASLSEALLTVQCPPRAPTKVLPGLPPTLDALLLRCLAPNHEDRYPDARALGAALEQWLQQEGRGGARRRRMPRLAAALVLSAGGLAAGIVTLGPRGSPTGRAARPS